MHEHSSTKLTPVFSESEAKLFVMSIYISVGGLTFCIYSEKESIIQEGVLLFRKDSLLSLSEKISDLVFKNPFLTYSYSKTEISFEASHFLLIPPGIDTEGAENLWLQSSLILSEGEGYIEKFALNNSSINILSSWDIETFLFLKRTYPFCQIKPIQVEFIEGAIEKAKNLNNSILFIYLTKTHLLTTIIQENKIILANQYPCLEKNSTESFSNEALFFLGNLCKQVDTLDSIQFLELNSPFQEKESTDLLQEKLKKINHSQTN